MANTIIKGDELMLFDANNKALAWATSHTLTITGNTVDISTKDHGFWGASEVGNLTWEITSENLYCDDNYDELFDIMVAKEPVTVAFAKVSNYDENGLTSVGGTVSAWTPDTTNYRSGQAVITSLTVNANTGENATYSVTFTGAGPLVKAN
ncbi:MAG: phage tail tube protein [Methanobrevibacter sp.]|nr:phage tail tube protein [Methanobrevibacter sp.]